MWQLGKFRGIHVAAEANSGVFMWQLRHIHYSTETEKSEPDKQNMKNVDIPLKNILKHRD